MLVLILFPHPSFFGPFSKFPSRSHF
jgi:hypothetical protein